LENDDATAVGGYGNFLKTYPNWRKAISYSLDFDHNFNRKSTTQK
jgi:hypothetical protein